MQRALCSAEVCPGGCRDWVLPVLSGPTLAPCSQLALWCPFQPLHREAPWGAGARLCLHQCSSSLSSLIPLSPFRYHKVLKKGKAKKALKEFEKLQKVSPSAALEELEKIEKARMMVRLPLSPTPWTNLPRKARRIDHESVSVNIWVLTVQSASSRNNTETLNTIYCHSNSFRLFQSDSLLPCLSVSQTWNYAMTERLTMMNP